MDILDAEHECRLIHALNVENEPENNFIENLVWNVVNLNATDENGDSALHIAARKNFLNPARILLEAGASVNIRGRDRLTPLHVSACNKHGTDKVRELIKYGADVNAEDSIYKCTPLHKAAERACVGPMQELLKNGAMVNVMDENFDTPLHYALCNRDVEWESVNAELIQSLLRAGADINLRGGEDWAPLHHAASDNLLPAVRLLLENNAKVNICDDDGWTPLHYAALNLDGPVEIIRELVKKGAFLNALTLRGESPLYYAVNRLNAKATRELLRCGASSSLEVCMKALESRRDIQHLGGNETIPLILKDSIRYTFLQNPDSFRTIRKQFMQDNVTYFLLKWSTPECNLICFNHACILEIEAMSEVRCACGKCSVWGSINGSEECTCDSRFAILKLLVSGQRCSFKDQFLHKLDKAFLVKMALYQMSFFEFKESSNRQVLNRDCMELIYHYVSFENLQFFFEHKDSAMDNSVFNDFLQFLEPFKTFLAF